MNSHAPRGAISALLFACAAASAQGYVDVTNGTPLTAVALSTTQTGTGIASGDFDRDGDQDLIVPGDFLQPLYYFRNDGGMSFTDLTASCGLGSALMTNGVAVGDIDNDGDLDLFVAGLRMPCKLFINDGTAHFTEQAAARGLVHVTANFSVCFGDYDRDGWLDIYLGNHFALGTVPTANILYRNTGGGNFVDVTAVAGVGDLGATFAAGFIDFDEDGWPDIATANDKGAVIHPNSLYRNNHDGTFTSVGPQFGANIAIDGMGIDFTDAFNDGGVDLYFSDTPPDHRFMVWDPAQVRYVDRTTAYGMVTATSGAWAVNFFDYDNDGWQDMHVVHNQADNRCYHNPGQPASALVPWPDTAPALGLNTLYEQYVSIVGDFDDDGGLDVCSRYQLSGWSNAPSGVRLMRNQLPRGNWIKLETRGTVSNRDGIGARIVVTTGNLRQRQWVRSGIGYAGSSDLRVHFGLGTASQADLVEITWPSGQVQYLTGVAANQIVLVEEPSMSLRAPAAVGATTNLDLSIPGDGGLLYVMGLSFADQPHTPLPGGRVLPLAVDFFTQMTVALNNPILPGASGLLDAAGQATSPLHVPNLAMLHGMTMFATGATVDTAHFPLVRTVFPEAVRIDLP